MNELLRHGDLVTVKETLIRSMYVLVVLFESYCCMQESGTECP